MPRVIVPPIRINDDRTTKLSKYLLGFHLSGIVASLPGGEDKDCLPSNGGGTSNTRYRVSLSFDRYRTCR